MSNRAAPCFELASNANGITSCTTRAIPSGPWLISANCRYRKSSQVRSPQFWHSKSRTHFFVRMFIMLLINVSCRPHRHALPDWLSIVSKS